MLLVFCMDSMVIALSLCVSLYECSYVSLVVFCLMVCYLARARAMARVVLAQIEFTRAICGPRKILPLLQCRQSLLSLHMTKS